jgi:hypothetical protein
MATNDDMDDPVCAECGRIALSGVVPIEPRYFCAMHPEAEVIERPTIMDGYREKLESLKSLEKDWDSYGADPVDRDALFVTEAFLEAIVDGLVSIVPMSSGGVQVEVHANNVDVEIEFEVDHGHEHDVIGFWERRGS